MGRVISQRRTKNEWDLLIAMHRGWYPLVDNQAFRRNGPPPRDAASDGRPPDLRQPVQKAIDHLARSLPAQDAGMDGVVGHHAPRPSRRHVGAQRMGPWQRRDLRHRRHCRRCRARRTSSRPTSPIASRGPDRPSRAPAARLSIRDTSGAAARRRPAARIPRCVKSCSSIATGARWKAAGSWAATTKWVSTSGSSAPDPNRGCSAPIARRFAPAPPARS